MKSILAMVACVLSAQAADAGRCHAVAFSSGDQDAAYQAGALKGITTSSKLTAADYAYDAVSGVSGGALNAVLLSSFAKGQEDAAADRMEQFWRDGANASLYKNWFGGIARGLFFEGGLYNSAPLEDFIKREFKDVKMNRKVDIGIVDVLDGSYKDFSQ
jgi:predicted acylesterase/phospholipase RssA